MGMEYSIDLPTPLPDLWPLLTAYLAQHGYPVHLRMIDGQLAFPDETPTPDWRELRLGTAHGMITVRREPQSIKVVTWGNADANMQQAWNAITWAVAETSQGTIHSPAGTLSAAEFRSKAAFPPELG